MRDEDWLPRRKLEMRAARMLRFIDMATQPKPIYVGWVISKEADLIRAALDGIEERWGDRAMLDAIAADEAEDDAPCTDCDDTGITFQTERKCSCQP